MKVTPIKKQFTRHGFIYKQEARDGAAALYSYASKGGRKLAGYEVVKLYTDPTGQEYFPGTSLWGVKGWTFTATQQTLAQNKFQTIAKEMKAKPAKGVFLGRRRA